MIRWMTGAVLSALALSLSAPVEAAGGLPVKLLDKTRVGIVCMDSVDTNAAVDCWLKKHPMVGDAMWLQEANFSGGWSTWPAADKNAFHKYFNLMVLYYRLGMPANFPQPLPNTLPVQGPSIFMWNGYHLTEADGRTEYLLLVGNSIAAELTAAFPWSISTYTANDLSLILAEYQILGDWIGPPNVATAGVYFVGIDPAAPAPPAYTLSFFKNNQLVGADAKDTIARVYMWERQLLHYFLDAGVDPADMEMLFWGPTVPPISESQLIEGTTYTGPAGPWFGHWTEGCHGTMNFMKRVLQAVNIPVQIWNTAQHATPYFTSVDLALTHGDDPYDRIGWITPVAGFPQPQASEYFVSVAQQKALCDPNWPDPSWCEHKVGIAPALVGIKYGSDYLMPMHCQDLAAGKPHAASSVFGYMKWYWPEKTDADILAMLEGMGLWTTLDAKVAATNFCQ